MKRHLSWLLVAATAAFGAFAPTAQAQTVPQSLMGEALLAGGEAGGVGSFDVILNCNVDGSFSFSASGIAVGPYPGTFTEDGIVTVLGTPLPDGTSLASFQSTFTIDSPGTATTITGTKTLRAVVPPEGLNQGSCVDTPTVASGQVVAFVTYDAVINSPLGTFRDTGNSTVDAENVVVDGDVLANDFKESFTLSQGVVPVAACEDDDDDDGSDDKQESLFGTLASNRDSDGDGTADGNEDSDDDGDDDEDEDDGSDECEPDSDEDGTDDEDEDDDDQPSPPAQNPSPVTAEVMQGPAPQWTQTNCNDLSQPATVTYTSSGTATGTYPGTYTETGTYTLGPSLADPSSPVLRPVTGFSAEFTIVSGTTTIEGTKRLAFRPEIQGDAACTSGDVSSFTAPGEACTYEAIIHTPAGSFRDRGECFVGMSSQGPFPPGDTFQGEFLENLSSDLTQTEPVCRSDDDDCEDDEDS